MRQWYKNVILTFSLWAFFIEAKWRDFSRRKIQEVSSNPSGTEIRSLDEI